jgi:DNA-binding beta-propeller fold protein YncE
MMEERDSAAIEQEDVERGRAQDEAHVRRLRRGLAILLVILFLLLVGVGAVVVGLVRPSGAPVAEDVPEGLTWVRSIYGMSSRPADQFYTPNHVAIGPNGVIWVTEMSKGLVAAFNPDGSFRRALTVGATGGEGMSMMSRPTGIAVSEDNEVYVASFPDNLVTVYDGDSGELLRAIKVQSPNMVAVRGERLFVSSSDTLYLFDTQGTEITRWASRGARNDQIDLPQGLQIGEDGTLYVSDTHNVQIKAFSPDGKSLKWAVPEVSDRAHTITGDPVEPAKEPTQAPDSTPTTDDAAAAEGSIALAKTMQLPAGMTMDAAGRLIFVDPFSFAIYAVDPQTGTLLDAWGGQGSADGTFNYPTGIAYDPARDWFAVTDTANGRVQIVRIDGSGGSPFAALRRIQGPLWLCSIPLILLILAVILATRRKRARERVKEQEETDDTEHESSA